MSTFILLSNRIDESKYELFILTRHTNFLFNKHGSFNVKVKAVGKKEFSNQNVGISLQLLYRNVKYTFKIILRLQKI